MASKRMFSNSVIDTDAFLDMPLSAQALYFHLNMKADDDGFVANAKRIQRTIGASEDDLRLLIGKRFLLTFDDGVLVIKHWKMHNVIRKDMYTPTSYQEDMAMLSEKPNKSYTLSCNDDVTEPLRDCTIDKIREDKNRLDKEIDKPIRHKYGIYSNVLLSDEDMEKLKKEFPGDYQKRIDRLSEYIESTGKKYKSHLATIRSWARRDKEQPKKGINNFNQRDNDYAALQKALIERSIK